MHGELADDGLARAGRGRDEHAAAGLERLAGAHLELVEPERVAARRSGSSGAGRRAWRRRAAAYRSAGVAMPAKLRAADSGRRTLHAQHRHGVAACTGSGADPLAVGVAP